MESFKYGGIEFAKGAKPSFADFKIQFGEAECFKAIPHKSKDSVMKKVHKDLLKHSKSIES